MPMTIGELRAALKAEGVAWRPDEALADHEPIARRALGADAPIEASNEPPFDLRRLGEQTPVAARDEVAVRDALDAVRRTPEPKVLALGHHPFHGHP